MRRALQAAFLLLSSSFAGAKGAQRLNVVVVDICSARADHFGLYGYARDTSPNLDALTKEAAVFDNAIAQSSWCRPNYASLFTGHTPEVHGMYTNLPGDLPPFEVPLPERLRRAGYRTAAFSGGVYMLPEFGLAQGFDAFVNAFSTAEASRLPASAQDSIAPALDWLRKQKGAPAFLYLAVDDLHVPYRADDPEQFDPGYTGIDHDTHTFTVPFFRAYNGGADDEALRRRLELFNQDPRNLRHLVAHYDASIKRVDREIGDFVRELKKRGLWKDTILIVTSDHGEMLGEHGLLGHTEGLYEGVLRVPMILHHPGFPDLAGKRFSQQVQRIDVTATLLDFAGSPARPGELQGRSLLPLLEDGASPWPAYAFAASKRNLPKLSDRLIEERVVRTERWKLHHYLYKDRFELYDLKADPLETTDVAAKHPEVVAELSFELIRNMELSRPHGPGPVSGPEPDLIPQKARQ